MIKDFIKGFSSYFAAFNFVTKHNLYSYFIISGLFSVVIGLAIFGLSYAVSGEITGFLSNLYPFEFGADYIDAIINYASAGLIIIAGFLIFKYVLLIFISPLMGPLSAKVETIITGRSEENKFSLKQLSYEMIRGIRLALRNITREIGLTIFLLLLGLIPLFTIFVTPLIFLVQAYYIGFSSFDYFLERRTNIAQSIQYVKRHRWQAIGNGTAFLLLLFIPFIGLFLAPVLGTIAATKTALSNRDYPNVILD